ncbi:MAG: hypothetical protein AAF648_08080 [Pseudomonadota bacterium]
MASPLGYRIQIIGLSCSGKSTLARQLADVLQLELVELDALNWLPDWVGLNATDPERFRERIRTATAGDRWVVAGSYNAFTRDLVQPRLDTLIWIDLPRWKLTLRMLRRSWQRARSRELLWGTNREKFWPQLMIWRGEDSLLWWIWTRHGPTRRRTEALFADPAALTARCIRLGSVAEIDALLAELRDGLRRVEDDVGGD